MKKMKKLKTLNAHRCLKREGPEGSFCPNCNTSHMYTEEWLKHVGKEWKKYMIENDAHITKVLWFIDYFFGFKTRICRLCKKEYVWTGPNQKYCKECAKRISKEYYEKNKPAPKPRIINCDTCGKKVIVTSSRQLRCVACKKKHVTTYNREYMRKYYPTHKKYWEAYWKKNHP